MHREWLRLLQLLDHDYNDPLSCLVESLAREEAKRLFPIFPAWAGNIGFEFSRSATPAKVPENPPWTVTIFLYADRHVTWENREVPPDVTFGLDELTLGLWKNGANSAVKCIRRLRLWACTHVEYGLVAPGPWMASVLKCAPDGVVFVFVLSVCPSRNWKST